MCYIIFGDDMNNNNMEIERKFLIRYPNLKHLEELGNKSDITQIYLSNTGLGSERVRCRITDGEAVYTHTVKKHITNISREEIEREISKNEFDNLLLRADKSRNAIIKTRYCVDYNNQCFEIDVYPFWCDRAVMEIELESETQKIVFPPFIELIKELTDDKRYTNASLAKCIPYDEI